MPRPTLLNDRAADQTSLEAFPLKRKTQSPLISQDTLNQYWLIDSQLRELSTQRDRMRKSILESLDQGIKVETGVLGAKITETVSRRFSFEGVSQILGEAEALRVRELLPQSTSRSLVIAPGAAPG